MTVTSAELAVGALFDRRIDGDDALLRLARLRFAQASLATETYADSPARLERMLGFAPAHPRLPVVHLSREVDVLHEAGRAAVAEFAGRGRGAACNRSAKRSGPDRPQPDALPATARRPR